MKNTITFDVMVGNRWRATLTMPVTFDMIVDYIGDKPVIALEAFKRYAEQKRPTLKYENYQICF